MIPPRAHGTAWELSGGELGVAEGATSPQLDQGPSVAHITIDGQEGPGAGIDVDDVIVVAAVLVRVLERAPPSGESEAAVVADQIA